MNLIRTGLACAAGGAAAITIYTVANYHLRRWGAELNTLRAELGQTPVEVATWVPDAAATDVLPGLPLDPGTRVFAYRIEPGEPYFQDLRARWSAALRAAHIAIPRPPYRGSGGS